MLTLDNKQYLELSGVVADIDTITTLAADSFSRWFEDSPESFYQNESKQKALVYEYATIAAHARIIMAFLADARKKLNALDL